MPLLQRRGTGVSGNGFARPGEFDASTIVGLWQVVFVSTITTELPDGMQINPGDTVDAGCVTWHADGTEIMNSGRPPMAGSVCMGIWKKRGARGTSSITSHSAGSPQGSI